MMQLKLAQNCGTLFLKGIQRQFLLVMFLVCAAHTASQACAYHSPETIRVGMLDVYYPNALHVTGAIWRAQNNGRLSPPDTSRIGATGKQRDLIDAMAYQRIVKAITTLGAQLSLLSSEDQQEEFSLVLAESALWSRFTLVGKHSLIAIDAGSPGGADLVIVTGEPVVYSMVRGDLTLSDAFTAGMAKLYGDQKKIDQFMVSFGKVGEQAQPTSKFDLNLMLQ